MIWSAAPTSNPDQQDQLYGSNNRGEAPYSNLWRFILTPEFVEIRSFTPPNRIYICNSWPAPSGPSSTFRPAFRNPSNMDLWSFILLSFCAIWMLFSSPSGIDAIRKSPTLGSPCVPQICISWRETYFESTTIVLDRWTIVTESAPCATRFWQMSALITASQ